MTPSLLTAPIMRMLVFVVHWHVRLVLKKFYACINTSVNTFVSNLRFSICMCDSKTAPTCIVYFHNKVSMLCGSEALLNRTVYSANQSQRMYSFKLPWPIMKQNKVVEKHDITSCVKSKLAVYLCTNNTAGPIVIASTVEEIYSQSCSKLLVGIGCSRHSPPCSTINVGSC